MEIKNLGRLAKRIRKAIDGKEHIILYGDSDLDGVTSVLILREAIRNLGGEVAAMYFPDREQEGYGITRKALQVLADYSPALLIAMDLGISNFEEIDIANEKGFEVLLIDHHQVLGKLPAAAVIVDPKQKGEKYPFRAFAACGLTFRVAEKMLDKDATPPMRKSLVELAALGTIADMMPREEDNVQIIEEGLSSIENSWRPGIQVFFNTPSVAAALSLQEKISQMISVLNVRDVKDGLPAAFRFFTAITQEEAQALLSRLWEINKVRQDNIRAFVEEVEERIKRRKDDLMIFEGGTNIDYVLLGAAASILSNRHKKPVFLYKDKGEEGLGSVRAPSGYDTVKAMAESAEILLSYGGHAQASGFRLKTENIEEFKKRLAKHFRENHP
ncbi:MAG: DHH family phosphoesterase [Candidatus Wildermuthbacteria bacterium]|nr:DHH family phosphoesterase [Candidatus Wildermuthbacteria bacterium]